jgi:isoquinoline 1-oxidoreductase beta subunit
MPSTTLTVNGKQHTIEVSTETPLLWVLRDTLGLTGTKYSCGQGFCGACTVHLNGEATRSCAATQGREALAITWDEGTNAGLDSENIRKMFDRIVAPSIMAQLFPEQSREGRPDAVDGAAQIPYLFPNILVDYVMANTAVPVGWWRSVYNTQNAFVNECFLDEIAVAAKVDPFELRRRSLPERSRLRGVLERVAKEARWDQPPATGRSRGIACHFSFGSYFAEVAEVAVDNSGNVRVHKVVCALDCGPVVNPDTIKAQVEGAVVYGLSAALKGEINIDKGRVQQANFDDYPMLTIEEMPEVEAHIIPSTEKQGGIGEPGVPPIAPAVCNAIFGATGKRIRRLPIRAADLRRT